MTDTKNHIAGGSASLEGRIFRPVSPAEVAEAVELAFDYRGDVTLGLTSGESLVVYLYNRETGGASPYLEVFPADTSSPRRIPYASIVTIAFTGEDTANGKSWEQWVAKKDSERKADAARVAEAARARGHL